MYLYSYIFFKKTNLKISYFKDLKPTVFTELAHATTVVSMCNRSM